MIPQEAYKRLQLKVNKNDTNGNVKIPKAQFVLIFNSEKRKWLDTLIPESGSTDEIEGIEELLEVDVPLTKVSEDTKKAVFTLPTNFFRRTSSYNLASQDDCKDQVVVNWFVSKNKNINVLLQNSDFNPSFDYRETLAVLNKDKLTIYKDNFTVDKTYLSYYREPKDIDINGYTRLDGTPSTDVTIDLSDINVELILDRVAVEVTRNYESILQNQLAAQRLQNK